MLKPGILPRRIVGEVLNRFERKGLKIIALKMIRITKTIAEEHYAEHSSKGFYQNLIAYTTSAPVIALILEGSEAVSMVRRLVGATNILDSAPGTIRGDFAYSTQANIVHASDSRANAAREIKLFFSDEEICDWEDNNAAWF